MARILLGVSGGIAAYKALEFVRLATKAGHAVRVIQTPDAQRFVGGAVVRGAHRAHRSSRPSGSATRRAARSPTRRRRSTTR